MLKAGIDPIAFSNIMDRMTSYMEVDTKKNASKHDTTDNILDYISSHPSTKERTKIADKYSQCFKKGLQVCEINYFKK